MHRRRFLHTTLPAAAAWLTGATACKRHRDPNVPEVWDDVPVPGHAEAIAKLAPPWPAPSRALLENQLLTFWLTEPASPAMHVRLMFPTAKPSPQSAVAASSVAESIRFELRRRLTALQVGVDVQHRPGRIEIALHGRDENVLHALRATGFALGRDDPSGLLLAARQRLVGRISPSSEQLAAAMLSARLLGVPLPSQHVDPTRIESHDRDDLGQAWDTMTDPRRSVMVVHAGTEPSKAAEALRELASSWEGKGRAPNIETSIGRLRPALKPNATAKHLLSERSAPFVAPVGRIDGSVSLVLGRTIPTPDAASRAIARLGQRVIQEELDARVTISGPHTVFAVHVSLPGGAPDKRARAAVDSLTKLAATRQPQQRLFHAAQLWLGARVVQASLDGEDWTALWSESIDLANADADIPRAMTVDATAMLEVEAEAMHSWQKQWLDPRRGAPGWQWVVAGADAELLRQLSRLAPIENA